MNPGIREGRNGVFSGGTAENKEASDTTALEQLYQAYWQPLYWYVRERGYSPHDAQDLTQEFFVRLLQKRAAGPHASREGGLRSFLFCAMNHFLVDQWRRTQATKRGGGQVVSLDAGSGDEEPGYEPLDTHTPEKLQEQNRALALLELIRGRLKREYETAGKGDLFELLHFSLAGTRSSTPYAELAARLHRSEGAIKVSVHRMRQRYRELLVAEIEDAAANREEAEEELRSLFQAFL